MSHHNQRQFTIIARSLFPAYFKRSSVLEIGAADINGSIKYLFNTSCRFIGIDIWPGKGVDILCPGHLMAGDFDTVISCEVLEHDQYWKETVLNAVKMTNKALLITCASTGRAEHGTRRTSPKDSPVTQDYYENRTIMDLMPLVAELPYKYFKYNSQSCDLYFIGFKEKPKVNPSRLTYVYFCFVDFYRLRMMDYKNAFLRLIRGFK